MFNRFISTVQAAALAVVVAAAGSLTAAHAQSRPAGVQADVPFAFDQGSKHFDAGAYSIKLQSDNILLICGAKECGYSMVRMADNHNRNAKAKLIFRRYGTRYFLKEVWAAGTPIHLESIRSKAEKQLEIASAHAGNALDQVALLELPQ